MSFATFSIAITTPFFSSAWAGDAELGAAEAAVGNGTSLN
jgi:hypothetical protein